MSTEGKTWHFGNRRPPCIFNLGSRFPSAPRGDMLFIMKLSVLYCDSELPWPTASTGWSRGSST